jgi:D-glycero-D-manno-heptose 1,7-bisphosphate phosphatase
MLGAMTGIRKKVNGRAIFLDRDGTIVHDAGYPRSPDQIRFLPDAAESMVRLKALGYKLVLVSNQSGVGRGILTIEEVETVHDHVVSCLEEMGVRLDGSYYCTHAPEEECSCRKPSPEMLLRASRELEIDPVFSFMVGDTDSDVEAGKRAGCRTILLSHVPALRKSVSEPDYVACDWSQILVYITECDAGMSDSSERIGEEG